MSKYTQHLIWKEPNYMKVKKQINGDIINADGLKLLDMSEKKRGRAGTNP